MNEHVGSFVAVDDAGNEYTIYMYPDEPLITGETFVSRSYSVFRGQLASEDGSPVEITGKKTYRINTPLGSILVTSDDPHAP